MLGCWWQGLFTYVDSWRNKHLCPEQPGGSYFEKYYIIQVITDDLTWLERVNIWQVPWHVPDTEDGVYVVEGDDENQAMLDLDNDLMEEELS